VRADAIVDRLRGTADDRTAFSTYHETVRYAADLRRLEA
jgi:hypothetical protein